MGAVQKVKKHSFATKRTAETKASLFEFCSKSAFAPCSFVKLLGLMM
jgi:hypothetical protein